MLVGVFPKEIKLVYRKTGADKAGDDFRSPLLVVSVVRTRTTNNNNNV